MVEAIGMLLMIAAVGVWLLVLLVLRLLNRKTELRPERLSVKHLGLSIEQHLRLCALARAQGISQKTLWRNAGLEYLDRHTQE